MTGAVVTRHAKGGDADAVATLFDGYRQFYGQPADPAAARRFIGERLGAADSVVIVAERDGEMVGFTQLYPSFTSVGMARTFILNDLFVVPAQRGTGAGRALLDAAAAHGRAAGAVRLTLSTQAGNRRAQGVYEQGGWRRDDQFHVYNFKLTD